MEIYIIKGIMIMNLITAIIFGIDKLAAISKDSRMSEEILIYLCIFGGAIGGCVGMQLFRHKTKKERFKKIVPFLAIIYLIILSFLIFRNI